MGIFVVLCGIYLRIVGRCKKIVGLRFGERFKIVFNF